MRDGVGAVCRLDDVEAGHDAAARHTAGAAPPDPRRCRTSGRCRSAGRDPSGRASDAIIARPLSHARADAASSMSAKSTPIALPWLALPRRALQTSRDPCQPEVGQPRVNRRPSSGSIAVHNDQTRRDLRPRSRPRGRPALASGAPAAVRRVRLRGPHLRSRLVPAPAAVHRLVHGLAGVLLGIFMGGMCLGSLLLPRYHRRETASAPKVYAYLELGIGVCGILVLFCVPVLGDLYTKIAGTGGISIVLRAVVASVCLLPPTLLMGATLPAIARWVETTPQGRLVARLLLRRQPRWRRGRQPAGRVLPACPSTTCRPPPSSRWR